MRKFNFQNKNSGFTIIETMIAVALFLIVILVGMDALLNSTMVHQKSQDMRSAIDGLTFMMDEISRNVRTGYNVRCVDDGDFSVSALNLPKSCVNGGGAIAFEHALGDPLDQNDQWVYKIESVQAGPFNVSKSVDSGATWIRLNSSDILINSFSGFSVLGAEPRSGGDTQQPITVIRLSGRVLLKNGGATPFSLQTTASQRLIDL